MAVGDVVQMLQYATYSVISPEGCASILWKSADKAPDAAETLGITDRGFVGFTNRCRMGPGRPSRTVLPQGGGA